MKLFEQYQQDILQLINQFIELNDKQGQQFGHKAISVLNKHLSSSIKKINELTHIEPVDQLASLKQVALELNNNIDLDQTPHLYDLKIQLIERLNEIDLPALIFHGVAAVQKALLHQDQFAVTKFLGIHNEDIKVAKALGQVIDEHQKLKVFSLENFRHDIQAFCDDNLVP